MNKRHELQKNELADWMEEKIEDTRPYFPAIGIGLVVALAIVVGVWWYTSQQRQASAAAWNTYFSAIGERDQEEALTKVIEDQKDSLPALWARQSLADMNLARGAAAVFSDREESKKRLDEAAKHYEQILDMTQDSMLTARATYGLARVKESIFEPEAARKLYESLAKESPNSPLGEAAAKSAERLSDPVDVELLAWLAKQEPRKAAPTSQGLPGGVPPLPSDLPDRPNLSIPGLDDSPSSLDDKAPGGLSFPPPGTTSPDDVPAETAPADVANPSDDAKPSDDATPSDDAKPADEGDTPPPADKPDSDLPETDPPSDSPAPADSDASDTTPPATDDNPPPADEDSK